MTNYRSCIDDNYGVFDKNLHSFMEVYLKKHESTGECEFKIYQKEHDDRRTLEYRMDKFHSLKSARKKAEEWVGDYYEHISNTAWRKKWFPVKI